MGLGVGGVQSACLGRDVYWGVMGVSRRWHLCGAVGVQVDEVWCTGL